MKGYVGTSYIVHQTLPVLAAMHKGQCYTKSMLCGNCLQSKKAWAGGHLELSYLSISLLKLPPELGNEVYIGTDAGLLGQIPHVGWQRA